MKIDGKICWAVCNRGGSINECGKITITKFDENTSGSQCKLDSTVQGTSRRAKERGGKTGGSRRNQRMEGRKNLEQKESKRGRKVFGAVERVYSRRRYMGEKENLKNVEEVLEEFEGRMSAEVRRQERIDMAEERNFRRRELPEKFTARMLYRWDDGKFEEEYLKKLKRNWRRWKAVSLEEKS